MGGWRGGGGGGRWGGGGGVVFFFNDTATTEIYTLSLHDALPILRLALIRDGCGLSISGFADKALRLNFIVFGWCMRRSEDTRLNSSHPSRSRMPSSA